MEGGLIPKLCIPRPHLNVSQSWVKISLSISTIGF